VIETGGAADCPGARAVSEKDGFSLVPTSPRRRTFEFALGSDNRSSNIAAKLLILLSLSERERSLRTHLTAFLSRLAPDAIGRANKNKGRPLTASPSEWRDAVALAGADKAIAAFELASQRREAKPWWRRLTG
jgi:hypothetical protein